MTQSFPEFILKLGMSGAITKGNAVRLLVAVAVLAVSLVVVQDPTSLVSTAGERLRRAETYELQLSSGWNYVSIPLKTDLTAKDACEFTGSENVVYRWDSGIGNWSGYNCMSPVDTNFTLEPNLGYAVHSPAAKVWAVSGRKSPPKVKLVEGWNFQGFPDADDGDIYALGLCGKNLSSTLEVVEVDRWINGGWEEYKCDSVNSFQVVTGQGYFLKAQVPDKPGKRPGTIPQLQ